MWKKKLLAAALLFGAVGAVQASDAFTFDYNGTAAGGTVSGVMTIDQVVGNALAVGGNPNGGLVDGSQAMLLYQANLGVLTDGTNILFTNGTDGNYFTFVAGFNETASVSGLTTNFTLAAGTSFFKMYATTAAGDNLNGTGFTSATEILSGTEVQILSSNFNATDSDGDGLPDVQQFDQFGGNDYVGINTIVGSGTSDVVFKIDSFDSNYFTDVNLINALITLAVNTSLVDPFKQVDPSACFNSSGTLAGECDTPSNIGTLNGGLQFVSDLNFQAQADGNASLTISAVPEPGSLALLGLGLGLCGLLRRRRT